MCGFAGIINSEHEFDEAKLREIAARVSFRGPDSCRVKAFDADGYKNAVFFNRLAIIDLDPRSDQPFEDEESLLLFNGEIYNYQDLKKALQQQGVEFHTSSDTEVLFYALRYWGKETLAKLNGMFAFCWVNKKSGEFIIARDRVGIKPLYYRTVNGSFVFGSEIHSLIRLSGNTPRISTDAVHMYLWMQFVPSPHSIFEGIYKLPPGNYIEGNFSQGLRVSEPTPYWDAYAYISSAVRQEKDLELILKDSLERQLHADVPLGLFLSSGTDSSLLAAMVNKHFAKSSAFNFYTIRFSESTSSDESRDAEDFIRGFQNKNLVTHQLEVDPDYVSRHLSDMYRYFDEPFADPASLLNWAISKKAREHVTVAISGDGADELFWGYARYDRWQKFARLSQVPVLSSVARSGAAVLPTSKLRSNASFVIEDDPVKRHYNLFLPSGMRFKIHDHITNYKMWATENLNDLVSRNDLPAILDIKTYLSDAMLYKVDRASMAASLEVRVPYLDNEVIDYALALPLAEKSTALYPHKAPLKKLLKQLAPHYDLARPKKGFSFPLKQWLYNNWKEQVMDLVTIDSLNDLGLPGKKYFEIVKKFYQDGSSYFTDVWFLYNLMLWKKTMKEEGLIA